MIQAVTILGALLVLILGALLKGQSEVRGDVQKILQAIAALTQAGNDRDERLRRLERRLDNGGSSERPRGNVGRGTEG